MSSASTPKLELVTPLYYIGALDVGDLSQGGCGEFEVD